METKQKSPQEAPQRRPRPEASENKPVKKRTGEAVRKKTASGSTAVKKPVAGQAAKTRSETKAAQAKAPAKKPAEKKAPVKTASEKAVPAKKNAQKKPSATKTAEKKTPAKKTRTQPEEDMPTKKRAYGNSKPKKRSALSLMAEGVKEKTKKRKAKKKAGASIVAPAVIYTEPRTFNRNRFLVQMVTVVAVVAAFVLALSVFFKVETITVTGADVYSAWAVREASGIQEGDNLLTFSHTRAAAQVTENLPYVASVRFGIKLPNTVNIIVEEEEVVYAIKDTVGQWWLMSSSGRIVEQANSGVAANYTQVLGVTLESPAVNLQALAAEAAPTETDASGEFIPVTVTGALRLNAAMQILRALEENDIVGDAASVDVTRMEDIILWYGTRYQVTLGDSTRLDYKIACMNDVILQMSDYQSGILDISFTNWPTQVGYTPFA